MGALYIIAGVIIAGAVIDLFATAAGDDEVSAYDYHFAMGVGAVFGSTK